MHELSIAMSVIEIADEYAAKENATVVKEIEIEVGELSGVVLDALEFAMEVAVRNTILEQARCHYIRIPGVARCKKCGNEFSTTNLYTPCPKCNSFEQEFISGRELRVKSLMVE